MVKYDITPFKFLDIVTKIEKDLVKLAFLAIKGKFLTVIMFKDLNRWEEGGGGGDD